MGDGHAGYGAVSTGFAAMPAPSLLQAARAGDRAAQGELYRLYAAAMYRLALRTLGSTSEAEEVVQDAFLAAIGGLPGFRAEAPFGLWLRRITAREAVRRLRRAPPASDDIDDLQLPDDEHGRAGTQWDLEQALMRLPAQSRSVLWLHLVEGHAHEDIAALFGKSVSFSKSQVARSVARLRQLLQVRENPA